MSLLIHMFFSFPCSILYCLYHKVSWTRHQLLTLFQHELTSTCADLNPTVPELVFIIRLALAKLENIYSLQACQLLSRREERGICHASPVSLSNSTSRGIMPPPPWRSEWKNPQGVAIGITLINVPHHGNTEQEEMRPSIYTPKICCHFFFYLVLCTFNFRSRKIKIHLKKNRSPFSLLSCHLT